MKISVKAGKINSIARPISIKELNQYSVLMIKNSFALSTENNYELLI